MSFDTAETSRMPADDSELASIAIQSSEPTAAEPSRDSSKSHRLGAVLGAIPYGLTASAAAVLAACGGGGGGGEAAPVAAGAAPVAPPVAGAPAVPGSPMPNAPVPPPAVMPAPPPVSATPAPVPVPAPPPVAPAPPAPAPQTPSVPAPPPPPPSPPKVIDPAGYAFPTAKSNEEAARFLLQAQFSASDNDIANVRSLGYAGWLGQQMGAVSQTGQTWLDGQGYANPYNTNNYYFSNTPGDHMIWNQLFASGDPVRKRVALALSEFFVVSMSSLDIYWPSHAAAAWWDLLSANAFGSYRKLLEDVTLSPAMGVFLNTKGNQKENASSGRQPDENYAREVMQLFTIGLSDLNADGTEKLDAQGKKIDSYTSTDVSNLARVFTGYDLDYSQNVKVTANGNTVDNTTITRLPMTLRADRHSTLEKKFLGVTIAANTPGAAALKTALDTLFNHPNTGPFFAKQMIQRLVTSNPSPAYVGRVAAKFADNGQKVRGDLAAVFAAVLLDDEARGPAGLTNTSFGKLREPMLRLVQWGRTFGITSANGEWKLYEQTNPANTMGQSPLRSPSVFNFFRPGYVPPNTAIATAKQVAPEFQLVNETSVGGWLNYMQNAIRYGMSGDVKAGYAAEMAIVTDAAALVARVNLLMTGGQLSAATVKTMVDALNATPVTATSSDDAKRNRIASAVLMTLASGEYLIQK